jgi:serine/threonine-protein kinase
MTRPSVPEQIEAAVERALEKLPADRWATAKEFSEALTGARVIMRSTHATLAESTTGFVRIGNRRVARREIIAWTIALLALGGAAATAFSARRVAAENPMTFEVLAPDSVSVVNIGGAAQIALSKDGSTLVFQGSRSRSSPMFYVRRLGELAPQEIRGSENGRSPLLSPDGTEIAFASDGGSGMIKRMPLHGGAPRALVDSATPNGQVSWDASGLIVVGLNSRLYTASADGGQRRLLASPDSSRGLLRYGFPDILPGGKAALITIWKGSGGDLSSASLGVVTIPDGKVTELGVRGTFPRYTPVGGGYIVYATAEAWIYAVPFSAGSRRLTGSPFTVAEGIRVGTGGAAALAVSDNGVLAYMSGSVFGNQRDLIEVNRAGTEKSLGVNVAVHNFPRVSPDGRQIAIETRTTSFAYPNPDIWRLDIATKVLDRVTTDSNSAFPTWFDDGNKIAFTRLRADSVGFARGLFSTAKPDTLLQTKFRLAEVSTGRGAKYVALRGGAASNYDIWVAHVDSLSAPRPFAVEPYQEIAPAVSPGGRFLAYSTNRTGRYEIYLKPMDGRGSEIQLSTEGGVEPVWGANDRELFYRGSSKMMLVRLSAGNVPSVTGTTTLFRDDFLRSAGSHEYDVFPDGQRFVMIRDRAADVNKGLPMMVMLNWASGRKTR